MKNNTNFAHAEQFVPDPDPPPSVIRRAATILAEHGIANEAACADFHRVFTESIRGGQLVVVRRLNDRLQLMVLREK